jgi:chromosome partitioning protein
VIIDCAPSLGLLTLNALAGCDDIMIPLQPHFLALQGLGKLLQTVDLVNKRINTQLKVKWVLMCMYDTRTSLSGEVRANIEDFLDGARGTDCAWSQARILPVYIRSNIKLAEAPSYGQTIYEYQPDCNGAEDYEKVADFLLRQYEKKDAEPAENIGVSNISDGTGDDKPDNNASGGDDFAGGNPV